jgi:hypothetical protein
MLTASCDFLPQCDVCKRISKDSIAYLDHINSRQREHVFSNPIPTDVLCSITNGCSSSSPASLSPTPRHTIDPLPNFHALIYITYLLCLDLRRLGQTTQVARSSLDQVRARIAALRAQTLLASESKQFDFEARLKDVHAAEEKRRAAEKEKRIKERAEKKEKERKERQGVLEQGGEEVMAGMGFGGFGSSKLKR